MKKAIVIVCVVVLLLSAWGNASLLPEVHKVAEWILVLIGLIISVLLIITMMEHKRKAAPGLVLFFSIALLNVIFLYVLTSAIGNFLLGGLTSIVGLIFSFQDMQKQPTLRNSSTLVKNETKEKKDSDVLDKADSDWDGVTEYDANPDLGLPQMLDHIPQNEPQMEVELETYHEPVIALGNEKVRRARPVSAFTKRATEKVIRRSYRKSRKKNISNLSRSIRKISSRRKSSKRSR